MTVLEVALQMATGKNPGELLTVRGTFYTYTYVVVHGGLTANWFPGVAFQSVEFVNKIPNVGE